jgi:hypothetical protein
MYKSQIEKLLPELKLNRITTVHCYYFCSNFAKPLVMRRHAIPIFCIQFFACKKLNGVISCTIIRSNHQFLSVQISFSSLSISCPYQSLSVFLACLFLKSFVKKSLLCVPSIPKFNIKSTSLSVSKSWFFVIASL